jgi:hypothetical protein
MCHCVSSINPPYFPGVDIFALKIKIFGSSKTLKTFSTLHVVVSQKTAFPWKSWGCSMNCHWITLKFKFEVPRIYKNFWIRIFSEIIYHTCTCCYCCCSCWWGETMYLSCAYQWACCSAPDGVWVWRAMVEWYWQGKTLKVWKNLS